MHKLIDARVDGIHHSESHNDPQQHVCEGETSRMFPSQSFVPILETFVAVGVLHLETFVYVVPAVEQYSVEHKQACSSSHQDDSILRLAAQHSVEEGIELVVEECHDPEPEASVQNTQKGLDPSILSVEDSPDSDVDHDEANSSDPQELRDFVDVLSVQHELVDEEGPQQEGVVSFPGWFPKTAVTAFSLDNVVSHPQRSGFPNPPSQVLVGVDADEDDQDGLETGNPARCD